MTRMNVCAVVGAQYGSEGKGAIIGRIAKGYRHHVRTGAANAGHTVWTDTVVDPLNAKGLYNGWEKHVLRQIPCAAYANPSAMLYIGPGALISLDVLAEEVEDWCRWRRERDYGPGRLIIDPRAHVVTECQAMRESESDLAERIGSTSATAREGIGTAQADRVLRRKSCQPFGDSGYDFSGLGVLVDYVPHRLAMVDDILLEGTQGAGLSLTTGQFPYVTSRNTTAAGLCADAGVAPGRLGRVVLVARTYPIRVAGNSGPFDRESREISWEGIGVDPESERTTVTRKVRRVATFSAAQVKEACELNGATELAITFADYVDPEVKGRNVGEISRPLGSFLMGVQRATGVPITMVGTGPHSVMDVYGGGVDWVWGSPFERGGQVG